MRALATALLLLAFAACEQSDKVSWHFSSEPGQGSANGGIVVIHRPGETRLLRAKGSGQPLALRVEDRGAGTWWLATESDALLFVDGERFTLISPALDGGRLEGLLAEPPVEVLDAETLLCLEIAEPHRQTLHLHAQGNLVWFGEEASPRTRTPPPPLGPETQMAFVASRDTVRFFDFAGQVTGEVPARDLSVQDGKQGVLLFGSVRGPAGSYTLMLPLRSHHLLLLAD